MEENIKKPVIKVLILEDNPDRMKIFRKRFNEIDDIAFMIDHVEMAQDCIEKLSTKQYQIALFDHDLGGEVYVPVDNKNTGSEVARWIAKNPENINKDTPVILHSLNFDGRQNMRSLISYSYDMPAAWTEDNFKLIEDGIREYIKRSEK